MASRLRDQMIRMAQEAKAAARQLAQASTAQKDEALHRMASALVQAQAAILRANARDCAEAKRRGLSQAFVDRLTLTPARIKAMGASLHEVSQLPDPVGEVTRMWTRPNGLRIGKVRVPIGVVGIIYESRPNVTADCIALGVKSGNSVILKGGREALRSNQAIFEALRPSLAKAGLPEGVVQLIQTTDRVAVDILVSLEGLIDLIVPRGSEEMIRAIARKARVPVIKHAKGLCHIYVDESADLTKALRICYNAKVQRPGVCNAMETLLVHRHIASQFLPQMAAQYRRAGVELRGCPQTREVVQGLKAATAKDWDTEYLDLILSVRTVESFDEAITHITRHSSGLSEAIITENYSRAMEFLRRVDSACVYVNASTRFTDGYQFGFGAEIGISTDRLHARGPMALEELTTYKYMIFGSGQIRES